MAELSITLFSVGDGDCILIEFPDGKLGLVDSCIPRGATSSPALSTIKAKGGVLEFLCLTHPHEDHFSGMAELLSDPNITVRSFWDTNSQILKVLEYYNTGYAGDPVSDIARRFHESKTKEFLEIYKQVSARKRTNRDFRISLSEFMRLPTIGGVEIQSLAPAGRYTDEYVKRILDCLTRKELLDEREANKISAVLELKYAGVTLLLGGDAHTGSWRHILYAAPRRGIKIECDVLKVSHHGAKDEYLVEMLNVSKSAATRDRFGLISAGSRTHPEDETLKYLKAAGLRVFKTGFRVRSKAHTEKIEGLHPVAATLLDVYSSSPKSIKCCGDITLSISDSGAISVKPELTPTCGICG